MGKRVAVRICEGQRLVEEVTVLGGRLRLEGGAAGGRFAGRTTDSWKVAFIVCKPSETETMIS